MLRESPCVYGLPAWTCSTKFLEAEKIQTQQISVEVPEVLEHCLSFDTGSLSARSHLVHFSPHSESVLKLQLISHAPLSFFHVQRGHENPLCLWITQLLLPLDEEYVVKATLKVTVYLLMIVMTKFPNFVFKESKEV